MTASQISRPWIPWVLVPGLVFLVIGAFIAFMPRGYSVNLGLIGQGRPAVVQVYDDNAVHSHELMEAFNKIRDDYEARVEFLVANLSLQEGKSFSKRYNADAISIVFFSPEGKVLHTLSGLQTPETLKKAIEQAFSF